MVFESIPITDVVVGNKYIVIIDHVIVRGEIKFTVKFNKTLCRGHEFEFMDTKNDPLYLMPLPKDRALWTIKIFKMVPVAVAKWEQRTLERILKGLVDEHYICNYLKPKEPEFGYIMTGTFGRYYGVWGR